MSETQNELDKQIKQFVKDFDLQMDSYKYNRKTMVITFHCVDNSPSEIDRWQWQVPAFVVGGYRNLINTEVLKALDSIEVAKKRDMETYESDGVDINTDLPDGAVGEQLVHLAKFADDKGHNDAIDEFTEAIKEVRGRYE